MGKDKKEEGGKKVEKKKEEEEGQVLRYDIDYQNKYYFIINFQIIVNKDSGIYYK